jgi:DNA repair exonuclease SbcCD ATPase subunit
VTGPDIDKLEGAVREALNRAGRAKDTLGWNSPGGYCPSCGMADGCHEGECEIADALAALSDLAARARERDEERERFHRHVETMIEPKLLAEADRLARRVAELENRLNADSQDFEIRCLREQVAEMERQRNEWAERTSVVRDLRDREGSWGAPYELSVLASRVAELEAALRQALEHMEFAYYPQTGDGPHLADPFDLMDKMRALAGDGGGA